MRRPITKEHAQKIVKKLDARVVTNRAAHDRAEFYYKGVLICSFGIRRSSNKSIGHGFIPNDLYLSHHETLNLANCPLSLENYVTILKEKGIIVDDPESVN